MALCVAAWPSAAEQPYPARPVRVVVPYPAGSTPDIVARVLGEQLHKIFGQAFLVDNRPGAAGNIGTEAVAKAQPDGYMLLVAVNGPVAVNKYLYKNLGYDPERDLRPVSLLAWAPQMLVVRPGVPAADLDGLVRYARAHPGRLSYASVGSGSASHLTMELLKSEAQVFIARLSAGHYGPHERQCRCDVRDHPRGAAPSAGRQASRPRGHVANAQRNGAGRAERAGGGVSGPRIACLDRPAGATVSAGRGGSPSKRGHYGRHACRRGARRAPRPRFRRSRRPTWRIRGLDSLRIVEMGESYPGKWSSGGLSLRFLRCNALTRFPPTSYNLCLFGRGVEQSGSSSGS